MFTFFLFSHPPIFNEPFGEEGLSEGRHISDSMSDCFGFIIRD